MSNNSRKNEYNILIEFDSTDCSLILDDKFEYPFSKSYKDDIKIKKNSISITALRSKEVDLDGVFKNHNSAIYQQIIKSLVYYFFTLKESSTIKSISIKHKVNDIEKKAIKLTASELIQPLKTINSLNALKDLDSNNIKIIFNESEKGKLYLNAMTFLIKSFHESDYQSKFDNLWRCFNAIYKAISGKTLDFDCHKILRQTMNDNPALFPLVTSMVTNLTSDDIRLNTRWNRFILNNHPTEKHTEQYKNFILRNEDKRLISIFKDTITLRQKYLDDKGFLPVINTHFDKFKNSKNDIHVAATLCIAYAYFVRNKIIHAENIDNKFRLVSDNKITNELRWISSILLALIIDLSNGSAFF